VEVRRGRGRPRAARYDSLQRRCGVAEEGGQRKKKGGAKGRFAVSKNSRDLIVNQSFPPF
jgi:hypothetical protein